MHHDQIWSILTNKIKLIMNNSCPPSVIQITQPTEHELLQDISTTLRILKKILSALYLQNSQLQSRQQTPVPENKTALSELMQKYRMPGVVHSSHTNTIQRFMIRVRELLHQFANSVVKYRLNTIALAKHLETEVVRLIEKSQLTEALFSIVEFVDRLPSQLTKSKRGPILLDKNQYRFEQMETIQRREVKTVGLKTRAETEVQKFMRTVQQYKYMGIDVEHLRGRYFNMKSNAEQEQKAMLNRNQYIQRLMMSFQKEHETYVAKNSPDKATGRSTNNKEKSQSQVVREQRQTRKRQGKIKQISLKNCLEESFQNTFFQCDLGSIDSKLARTTTAKTRTSSFRQVYQERFNQRCIEKKCHMTHVTITEKPAISEEHRVLGLDAVQQKRREFLKKTKEQSRFRYKYYRYIRNEGGSNKVRAMVNPETLYTTLTYH